ncbi:MAG: HEAT repeat domain-containing protein, partial [Planctomycetales bacterium]|nr:HEAT repeat domain-containing protein [Planctomycetales bacterium]
MSFKPILTRAVPAALLAASFLCWNLSSVAAANRSSAELVAVIQSPDASDHDKAVACEELAAVGDVESIAPLVSLLGDPKFSHYARFALQANPDPAAGEALRDALDRVEGLHLAGVVNTLAARRDLQAVPQLAKLIGSDDRQVAVAAAGALATIGGQDALAALTQSPQARDADFADAMLTAAIRLARDGRPDGVLLLDQIRAADFPQQVRQAAALALVRFAAPDEAEKLTRELLASQLDWEFEAGLQAAVQTDRSGLGAVLAEAFGDTTVARQIRLLAAITAKGDPAALDAVRAAASHQDPKVREAAVAALGTLGELADAPLLVRLALEDPKCGPVARESLGRIRDEQLDGYLLTTLETAEPAQQMLAADLIGQRR